jgi:hypothetical protein
MDPRTKMSVNELDTNGDGSVSIVERVKGIRKMPMIDLPSRKIVDVLLEMLEGKEVVVAVKDDKVVATVDVVEEPPAPVVAVKDVRLAEAAPPPEVVATVKSIIAQAILDEEKEVVDEDVCTCCKKHPFKASLKEYLNRKKAVPSDEVKLTDKEKKKILKQQKKELKNRRKTLKKQKGKKSTKKKVKKDDGDGQSSGDGSDGDGDGSV